MIRLVYMSRETSPTTKEDLEKILEVSRRNNSQVDITGILLYKNGIFFQVLEGPEDAVQETYARIDVDPRHDEVELISEEEITERDFPQWEMGFINMDSDSIRGFTDFLFRASPTFETLQSMGNGERLAHTFKDTGDLL